MERLSRPTKIIRLAVSHFKIRRRKIKRVNKGTSLKSGFRDLLDPDSGIF